MDYEKMTKVELISKLKSLEDRGDVVKRNQAEGIQKKYAILFNNITDLVYICDTKKNVLFVNKIFEKLTNHKTEEFIGRSFAPLFDEENLKKAMEVYTRTLNGESPQYELYFKDTKILCEYKNLPLKDEKENIIGVIGIARDITERRQTEQFLKESEEKYRTLFEMSQDAIVCDINGIITDWNKSAEKIFGYLKNEIIGKPIETLIPEKYKKEHQEGLARFLKTGKGKIIGKIVEVSGITKEGIEIPIEISLSAQKIKNKHYFFTAAIRSISERKRSEEVLKKS